MKKIGSKHSSHVTAFLSCKDCTHFKVDALYHIPNIENTRGRTLKWKTRSPWSQYVITHSCGSPHTTRGSPMNLIWQIDVTWQMQKVGNLQSMVFPFIPNVIALLLVVSWPLSHCIGTTDLCMQPGVARTSAFQNNSNVEKCHNHIIRSWKMVLPTNATEIGSIPDQKLEFWWSLVTIHYRKTNNSKSLYYKTVQLLF